MQISSWAGLPVSQPNQTLPFPPLPSPRKNSSGLPSGDRSQQGDGGGVRKRLWEEVGRLGQGVLAGGLEVHGNNVNKKLASDKKGRETCHDFNPNVIAPVVIVHQATLLLDIPPGFL